MPVAHLAIECADHTVTYSVIETLIEFTPDFVQCAYRLKVEKPAEVRVQNLNFEVTWNFLLECSIRSLEILSKPASVSDGSDSDFESFKFFQIKHFK